MEGSCSCLVQWQHHVRHRHYRITFVFVTVTVILVFLKYRSPIVKNLGREQLTDAIPEVEQPKLVLFYTRLFGRTPWPSVENDYQFTNWNNISCAVRNCRISYNKEDLNQSDAVIFHGQDIDGLNLKQLSGQVSRRRLQRWVFFLHENPLFFTHKLTSLDGVFNWTMTYKLNSDLFVPYFYYFPKKDDELDFNDSNDHALGKDRLVAWMVSHCGKQRDRLVKGLMEYIPVHVYGNCAPNFAQDRRCDRRDKISCLKLLRRYKFYLAFENAHCIDYITEKYWETSLQNGVVPVVLGGGNYSNSKLAVPGSFVNAMDFRSVKDLAEYLLRLDKNDTAYNEYFAWEKLYYLGYPPSWTCKLCSMINNASIPEKTYDLQSLTEFWGRATNCGFLDQKLDQIISSS